jgi:hypothetical protein
MSVPCDDTGRVPPPLDLRAVWGAIVGAPTMGGKCQAGQVATGSWHLVERGWVLRGFGAPADFGAVGTRTAHGARLGTGPGVYDGC